MKTIHYLLLLMLCLGTMFSHAQEPRFAPGQAFVLRISGVPGEDLVQVSGNYTISSNGTVKLPYLTGEISANGLTPTELMRKIETAYKTGEIYLHPTINISTTGNGGGVDMLVTVGGEVRNPGEVPFRPGINLYSAISSRGGPTEYADMKKVKLLRNKTERIYDLRKVTNENNPELLAGDQIVVTGG